MRFLCLGNSLTAGFPAHDPSSDGISRGYGNYKSQYEYWLKEACIEYIKENSENFNYEIAQDLIFINKGIPGETTQEFLRRVDFDLLRITPKPDYSIIIGGTNDLGWGLSNDMIFENIIKLHSISRNNRIVSIGATIPPIRMEQSSGTYNKRKLQLNQMLKAYFNENQIHFADLYKGMVDEKGNLKAECAFADGLHFSVEGYRQMGMVIFQDAIKSIVERHYF